MLTDYFRDELAKTVSGTGTLLNLEVADIKLVDDVNNPTTTVTSYTGVLSFALSATTGRATLENDITFTVPAGTTVGGWIVEDGNTTPNDLFGEALTSETFNGEGQYILEATNTYIEFIPQV